MRLLVRTDANARTGSGHVMRCLALAQAWQDAGGAATFAVAAESPALAARLRPEGMDLVTILTAVPGSADDARQTARLARDLGAKWVVVDGYHFGADYQSELRAAGLRQLFIDDYGHAGEYRADLVLNQNAYADPLVYTRRDAGTRLLLGARYAMLRREFSPWQGRRRLVRPAGAAVLITFGGADPANATETALRAVGEMDWPGLEAAVVVGANNPRVDALAGLAVAAGPGGAGVRLLRDVRDMPALMWDADLALAAAGSTGWEMAFLGLPAVVVATAENQVPVAEALERHGAAVSLGRVDRVGPGEIADGLRKLLGSPDLRQRMADAGQRLVDGKGARRVVAAMREAGLSLRRAGAEDCRRFWEWANDPAVRVVSFSSDPIPWDRHVAWFSARVADPSRFLYVALDEEGTPLGQVRFEAAADREAPGADEAVISISLGAPFRGRGLGPPLIRLAVQTFLSSSRAAAVRAYMKPGNKPSARSFLEAGFSRDVDAAVGDQTAWSFVFPRPAAPAPAAVNADRERAV